ncbi:hypothetical protein Tco_0411674 [Tanacetum coccineum]
MIKEETIDVDSYNRKKSSINFNVITQEYVINDPTHPTDLIDAARLQDLYKGKDVQEGVANVTASLKDKNKGKNVQEGSKSESGAQPLRKSKRLRNKEPQAFMIYVKNRGTPKRKAKLQGKNFKFNAQGTGSTHDKAFYVSESE